jgi:hypothetical protein
MRQHWSAARLDASRIYRRRLRWVRRLCDYDAAEVVHRCDDLETSLDVPSGTLFMGLACVPFSASP